MPTGKTQRSAASTAGNIRKAPEMRKVHKLNGQSKTELLYCFLDIMTGDPERSMEGAKGLMGLPEDDVPTRPLAYIVSNARYKEWSRIAAAYALGFLPLDQRSTNVLRHVLADRANSVRVRSHIAESLGNLQDQRSIPVLKSILLDSRESSAVRKWCVYALGEISSKEAHKVLQTFADTRPQGMLAAETNRAYGSLSTKVLNQ